MELEQALFRFVSGVPAITQYIGAAPQPVRMFQGKAPQGVKSPFIIQQRSGSQGADTYCGVDGSVRVSLQVDHYAKTWPEMAALGKAFWRALRKDAIDYPFQMGEGDSPDDSVRVKGAFMVNEFDSLDPDPGLQRRTQLWSFWIWEP